MTVPVDLIVGLVVKLIDELISWGASAANAPLDEVRTRVLRAHARKHYETDDLVKLIEASKSDE